MESGADRRAGLHCAGDGAGAAFTSRKNLDGSETLVANSIEATYIKAKSVTIRDDKDRSRVMIFCGEDGEVWFSLWDTNGRARVAATCDADGDGARISVIDKDNKRIWSAPPEAPCSAPYPYAIRL